VTQLFGRLFGTNGVRGVVNEDLTVPMVQDLGRAIGTHLGPGPLALAGDTRTSREMFRAAVVSGLLAAGTGVVDLGVCPTPCLQFFVRARGLRGGVMVTASHNPPEYNGIKVIDGLGMEAPREVEEAIEAIYASRGFAQAPWRDIPSITTSAEAIPLYLQAILARVDREACRRAALRVVVDCGNGASCFTTPYLLRELGCRVITLNGQPDGRFPGHPPEPVPQHVGELMELVKAQGADLGLVHDGDADRVIFVDERGEYVHGDRSLALMAGEVTRARGGGTVVTPVSSSSCVEDMVRAAGGKVLYTRVGAPVVARAMLEVGAIFGGEENGGLIFPDHQLCRDGAMGAARMVEILARTGDPLSKLLARVPRYALHKTSVAVPGERREEVLRAIAAAVEGQRVETIDGVKVHYPEGWVLIRPSGTEEIFRIFAEAREASTAKALAARGSKLVEEALGSAAL
jgi:phosphomannomutase/phosphoglucomutase